jgi:hypothetical protein
MEPEQVAELAAVIRQDYSPAALDPGVSEPTIVQAADGSRALVVPREQQVEPLRSMQLVDAAAVGATLVVTFTWADGTDDETVYLMPFDARELDIDLTDPVTVSAFLLRHIEHPLGGPRDSWASRSTMISERLSVVTPWTAR